MIDINATLLVQMLNFFILVALLRAFAYKPLAKALEARSEKIASSLQKADEDQAKAAALVKEYEGQLSAARVKAQEIVDMASKRAEEDRLMSVEATKKEIEQMKKAAEAQIAFEKEQAARAMKGEMVTLSLAAASKLLGKTIDSEADRSLVEEFIGSLDKDKLGGLSC